nr:hypothetical protein [Halalkalibacter urbisdiaboli]
MTKNIGRGYSFEALRAKVLFTEGYRKAKKKKSSKMSMLHSENYSITRYNFNHLLLNGFMKKSMVLTFPHYYPITQKNPKH